MALRYVLTIFFVHSNRKMSLLSLVDTLIPVIEQANSDPVPHMDVTAGGGQKRPHPNWDSDHPPIQK